MGPEGARVVTGLRPVLIRNCIDFCPHGLDAFHGPMVIEGEFRLGIVLANKRGGGFNRQFGAGAAMGSATSPVRDKDG